MADRASATTCGSSQGSRAPASAATVKGGLIVTGTGLVFATAADRKVHVYDSPGAVPTPHKGPTGLIAYARRADQATVGRRRINDEASGNAPPRTEICSLRMRSWYIRAAPGPQGNPLQSFRRICAQMGGKRIAPSANGCSPGGTMARLNADPYAGFHLFALINRVTALLDNEEAVTATVKALEADGVATGDIEIFTGEQGAKVLDLSGREHGRAIHLLRALEATMGDERETNHASTRRFAKERPWSASRSRRPCQP